MKSFLTTTLLVIIISLNGNSQYKIETYEVTKATISSQEYELYNKINSYRKKHRLEAIPLSKALSHVAKVHCKDLELNLKKLTHGWSTCKYNNNQSKTYPCMWEKPNELTSYKGTGYECAHGGQGGYVATAETSIESWKKSTAHNNVILNKSIWKNSNWKAIGIGIYKGYSAIWFGEEKDTDGSPKIETK